MLGWRPLSLSVFVLGVGHFVCACVGTKRKRKSRFCLRLLAEAFLYVCTRTCPQLPSDAPRRGSGAWRWPLPWKIDHPRGLAAKDTGGAPDWLRRRHRCRGRRARHRCETPRRHRPPPDAPGRRGASGAAPPHSRARLLGRGAPGGGGERASGSFQRLARRRRVAARRTPQPQRHLHARMRRAAQAPRGVADATPPLIRLRLLDRRVPRSGDGRTARRCRRRGRCTGIAARPARRPRCCRPARRVPAASAPCRGRAAAASPPRPQRSPPAGAHAVLGAAAPPVAATGARATPPIPAAPAAAPLPALARPSSAVVHPGGGGGGGAGQPPEPPSPPPPPRRRRRSPPFRGAPLSALPRRTCGGRGRPRPPSAASPPPSRAAPLPSAADRAGAPLPPADGRPLAPAAAASHPVAADAGRPGSPGAAGGRGGTRAGPVDGDGRAAVARPGEPRGGAVCCRSGCPPPSRDAWLATCGPRGSAGPPPVGAGAGAGRHTLVGPAACAGHTVAVSVEVAGGRSLPEPSAR